MPAASYREGPDGHSSRKQNSKRRRAKCSPSFVSGRVIGHGDISPRCIPECSAMARCTAPYPLLAPAAPALCLSCFWRGRSPSPAFGAVFMRGGRQLFGAGRIQAFVHGKIFANAFSGDWQWQYTRANAFSGDWQWQYTRAVRSRVPCRDKIPPRCVPGRLPMAKYSRNAFPGGNPWQVLRSMHPKRRSRTGKSPVRGKIRAPCIRNELVLAGYARHASEKPRKSPFGNARREDLARKDPFSLHGPLESRMARRSCHPLTLDLSATRRLR